jgi:hypothetical protein
MRGRAGRASNQLELARQNVRNARFIKADMTTIALPPDSFEAVTAFYSIGHVPPRPARPSLPAHRHLAAPGWPPSGLPGLRRR